MNVRFAEDGQPNKDGVTRDSWAWALENAERMGLRSRAPAAAGRFFQKRSGWEPSFQQRELAVYSGMMFGPVLVDLADAQSRH